MNDVAPRTAPTTTRRPAVPADDSSLRGDIEGLLKQRSAVDLVPELEMMLKLGQEAARLVESFYASGAAVGVLRIKIEPAPDGVGREIRMHDCASTELLNVIAAVRKLFRQGVELERMKL